MKRLLLQLVIIAGIVASTGCAGSTGTNPTTNLSGIYLGPLTLTPPSGTTNNCGSGMVLATIQQDGGSLSGTWTSSGFTNYGLCGTLNRSGSLTGTVSGSTVTLALAATNANGNGYSLIGHVQTQPNLSLIGTFTESLYISTETVNGGAFSITAQ
jgi:hypothetical protein